MIGGGTLWRKVARLIDPEALIWAAGLLLLALSDPRRESPFTLFWPYYVFGIESPGHQLGHAVSWLFRGEVALSWQCHWLGMPAVLILGWRIVTLTAARCRRHRAADIENHATATKERCHDGHQSTVAGS